MTGAQNAAESVRTRKSKAIAIAALAFLAVAVAYGIEASGLVRGTMATPGPGLFPLFVITPLLVVGSVGLLAAARTEQGYVHWPGTAGWARVAIVTAAAAGYVVAAPALGHALVTGLLTVVLLSVFGLYGLVTRLAVAVVIAVGSDLLFSYVLGSPLPRGPFGWYW